MNTTLKSSINSKYIWRRFWCVSEHHFSFKCFLKNSLVKTIWRKNIDQNQAKRYCRKCFVNLCFVSKWFSKFFHIPLIRRSSGMKGLSLDQQPVLKKVVIYCDPAITFDLTSDLYTTTGRNICCEWKCVLYHIHPNILLMFFGWYWGIFIFKCAVTRQARLLS